MERARGAGQGGGASAGVARGSARARVYCYWQYSNCLRSRLKVELLHVAGCFNLFALYPAECRTPTHFPGGEGDGDGHGDNGGDGDGDPFEWRICIGLAFEYQ